jgi:hypothetical protein
MIWKKIISIFSTFVSYHLSNTLSNRLHYTSFT